LTLYRNTRPIKNQQCSANTVAAAFVDRHRPEAEAAERRCTPHQEEAAERRCTPHQEEEEVDTSHSMEGRPIHEGEAGIPCRAVQACVPTRWEEEEEDSSSSSSSSMTWLGVKACEVTLLDPQTLCHLTATEVTEVTEVTEMKVIQCTVNGTEIQETEIQETEIQETEIPEKEIQETEIQETEGTATGITGTEIQGTETEIGIHGTEVSTTIMVLPST